MLFQKITCGYVIQKFNDQGECLGQSFHADNGEVIYECEENGHCEEINMMDMPFGGNEYYPFDMVQPQDKDDLK